MPGKTNYLSIKLLDHTLKNAAWTSPTTIYMALLHNGAGAVPTITYDVLTSYEFIGTGTPNGNGYTGYARATISASLSAAGSSTGGTSGIVKNGNTQIQFAGATGGNGTVNAFLLTTGSVSASNEQLLYYGTVTPKLIDSSNTPPTVALNALNIEES